MATKSRYKKYAEGIQEIRNNRQNLTKKVHTESVLQKLKNAKSQAEK
jgi:hypothetical protein